MSKKVIGYSHRDRANGVGVVDDASSMSLLLYARASDVQVTVHVDTFLNGTIDTGRKAMLAIPVTPNDARLFAKSLLAHADVVEAKQDQHNASCCLQHTERNARR